VAGGTILKEPDEAASRAAWRWTSTGSRIIRAILLLAALLVAVGWGIVIGNAILPGSCPTPV
jgi:hypothetical protein